MSAAGRTIVVGAGISGLARAHALGPDADVLVVDAADRPGGLMVTERDGDVSFELGPETVQSGSLATDALLDDLEIEVRAAPAAARKRYLVYAGRLVALPSAPTGLIGFPALTWRGKLRLVSEPFRRKGVALDGSLADFVRHRLGEEALATLVDPFVGGIHAGDPEQLSFRAVFPQLHALVAVHGSILSGLRHREGTGARPSPISLPGGSGSIPRALAERLGDRLRLGATVTHLERSTAGWSVRVDDEPLACDRLVLAPPAAAAARLLRDAAPRVASELASIESESIAVVYTLWPRGRVGHPLDGFGYLAPSRERLGHLGTLFSSSLRPEACAADHALLRTFLGGARDPAVVELGDDDLVDRTVRETTPLLGLAGAPIWTRVDRWPRVLPRYDLDHPARVARIRAALAALPGLELRGNYLDGIGVNALIEAGAGTTRSPGARLSGAG